MNLSANRPLRALITGGGRRIGAELVKRCADMGFEIYCHVNKSLPEAQTLLKTLPENSIAQITCCDLGDPDARRLWLETLPGFDLVINNASCYRLTRAEEYESPQIRQHYWQVNYYAPLEIIQHQLNSLSSGASGVCVTLLDCDVLTCNGGLKELFEVPAGADSYLATRIALGHKLLQQSKEMAPHLRLNCIAPGPVLPPVNCTTAGMTRILERVPLHRSVGTEEIANAVEFFWRNTSLTGVILPVDGGMHLVGN